MSDAQKDSKVESKFATNMEDDFVIREPEGKSISEVLDEKVKLLPLPDSDKIEIQKRIDNRARRRFSIFELFLVTTVVAVVFGTSGWMSFQWHFLLVQLATCCLLWFAWFFPGSRNRFLILCALVTVLFVLVFKYYSLSA